MRTTKCRTTLSTTVLLIAVLLHIVASGVAAAKPLAVVTLKDGSVVSGADVLLGKIAQIEGPDDIAQALSEVVVGRAPLPGKGRAISIGNVEVRLRQVGISTRDVEVRTDNGEEKITVVASDGASPAVSQSPDGGSDSIEVWCLVSGLERHAPVTPDLVEKVAVPRYKFVGTPVQSEEQLMGMRAKRTLRAGEVLTEEMLEPIPLVSKGSRVLLRATYGGVQVATAAVAESDGALGDVIPVVNIASGKTVHAYVIGQGTVEAIGAE